MSDGRGLEEWLSHVLSEELDLRPPKTSHEKEMRYLSRTAHITLWGEKQPAGHCELRRCGKALELSTVIVDKAKRGIGISHELVRIACERAGQDPIVSAQPLDRFEPPLVFCFTRSAALATTLTKAGFKIQPAQRKMCRLFLWKSASANLPFGVQLALFGERFFRYLSLLLTHRKKAKAQTRHLSDYHLFTRIAGSVGQREEPLTTEGVFALGMNVVRVTDDDLEKDDGPSLSTKSHDGLSKNVVDSTLIDAWDGGEKPPKITEEE